jgi:hypothetical protein
MTRKDYILIADILIAQYRERDQIIPIDNFLGPAVEILQQSNSSFDPQKFRNYVLKGIQK